MEREATCKVLDLAEYGSLSWEAIARECLERMSEDDVADMAHELDWFNDDEDEDEGDDEDEDDFDLQRQAHVKLADGRELLLWVLRDKFNAGDNVESLRKYIVYCLLSLQKDPKSIAGFKILNEDALCKWLGIEK